MSDNKEYNSKMETNQFSKWCKDERNTFASGMIEHFDWYLLKPEQRVVVENVLICFDQLVERQKGHCYTEQEVLSMLEALRKRCASECSVSGLAIFVKQAILSVDYNDLLKTPPVK